MPDRTIQEVGTAFEAMINGSDSVRKSAEFLELAVNAFKKVLIPILAVLLLIVAGLLVTVKVQNDNAEARAEKSDERIDKLQGIVESLNSSSEATKAASLDAKRAAESANETLNSALANATTQRTDTSDAFSRLNEIYETCVKRKEC